jgi:hypothetical protein
MRAACSSLRMRRCVPLWYVTATVTILDHADFSAGGEGDRRYLVPGPLADVYRATAALQRAKIHPDYWHTITFVGRYRVPGFEASSLPSRFS